MARTFLCIAAVEVVDDLLRALIDAGLHETQVSVVYPPKPGDAHEALESVEAAAQPPFRVSLRSLAEEDAASGDGRESPLDLLGLPRRTDRVLLSVHCDGERSFRRVWDVFVRAGAGPIEPEPGDTLAGSA